MQEMRYISIWKNPEGILNSDKEFSVFVDRAFEKHCRFIYKHVQWMREHGFSKEAIKRFVYENCWYK